MGQHAISDLDGVMICDLVHSPQKAPGGEYLPWPSCSLWGRSRRGVVVCSEFLSPKEPSVVPIKGIGHGLCLSQSSLAQFLSLVS